MNLEGAMLFKHLSDGNTNKCLPIINRELIMVLGKLEATLPVKFLEISKCSFRNVSDLSDFRSGISVARYEPQGSTTSLGSPLESLHDWID